MDRMVSITKSVIADMSEGVMAISHKGIIELVNGAALTILGREEDELVGHYLLSASLTRKATTNSRRLYSTRYVTEERGRRDMSPMSAASPKRGLELSPRVSMITVWSKVSFWS